MDYINLASGKRYTFIEATASHVLVENEKGEKLRIRPDYFKKFFVDPKDVP